MWEPGLPAMQTTRCVACKPAPTLIALALRKSALLYND